MFYNKNYLSRLHTLAKLELKKGKSDIEVYDFLMTEYGYSVNAIDSVFTNVKMEINNENRPKLAEVSRNIGKVLIPKLEKKYGIRL